MPRKKPKPSSTNQPPNTEPEHPTGPREDQQVIISGLPVNPEPPIPKPKR